LSFSVRQIPPGPPEKYDPSQDLLSWIVTHFKEYGDIYKASIYGANAYVVSDLSYVQHVLRRNWENYTKGQDNKRVRLLLGNGLMVSKGEFWIKQRRMSQPAFRHESIGALLPVFRTANLALLKKWERAAERGETVNVTRDTSLIVLEVVLISIFGDDYAHVGPHFRILSDEPERNLKFAQEFKALEKVVGQVIDKRRTQNAASRDILDQLMEARDKQTGEAMSDQQLVTEIMGLVVAGHETTASTLNWIWYLLSQHSDAEQKLSNELNNLPGDELLQLDSLAQFSYVRQVIEEALRLYPAGWLLTRKALKADQLGEYFVPPGTEIYISPYLIQRHPAYWEAPDEFNPDRFNPDNSRGRHELAMLPFSVGPRNCIGELLARIEMQIHLITVARKLRLRYVQDKPLELDIGINLRSKHDFKMSPEIKSTATRLVDHREVHATT
jgi:cytochrome P450